MRVATTSRLTQDRTKMVFVILKVGHDMKAQIPSLVFSFFESVNPFLVI